MIPCWPKNSLLLRPSTWLPGLTMFAVTGSSSSTDPFLVRVLVEAFGLVTTKLATPLMGVKPLLPRNSCALVPKVCPRKIVPASATPKIPPACGRLPFGLVCPVLVRIKLPPLKLLKVPSFARKLEPRNSFALLPSIELFGVPSVPFTKMSVPAFELGPIVALGFARK